MIYLNKNKISIAYGLIYSLPSRPKCGERENLDLKHHLGPDVVKYVTRRIILNENMVMWLKLLMSRLGYSTFGHLTN